MAGLAATRAELVALEFALERDRLLRRLALGAAGILATLFGALGLGAFVIAHFWETGRLAAILVVAAVFLVAGAVLLVLAIRAGHEEAPFAETMAEFRRDAQLVAEVLGQESREDENP